MNEPQPDCGKFATTADLTVELCSSDGTSTEFYQTDEDGIRKTLRSLATPRLLTQSQLVLKSEYGLNTFDCRSIDVICARTCARPPQIFPLIFPAGLLDIVEIYDDHPRGDFSLWEDSEVANSAGLSPFMSLLQIHTAGGWVVPVRVLAMARGTAQDQRQASAQIRELPVIPFRLLDGGIGLINPNNITCVSSWANPDAPRGTALPFGLTPLESVSVLKPSRKTIQQ